MIMRDENLEPSKPATRSGPSLVRLRWSTEEAPLTSTRKVYAALPKPDWQVKYEAWESIRDSLRDDPATLVLFDFENQKPWDRELQNRRADGPNAAIIGAQWTEGRWPGKGAIEFKRITDRIRLNIPGEFDELTFAARVRVEGLDRWLSSLMLTDNFDSGEVHWQISDEGEMILGVQTDKKGGPNTYSPPVIGPSNLGRWIHVATTANRNTGRVAHYFNGKLVKEEFRKDPHEIPHR